MRASEKPEGLAIGILHADPRQPEILLSHRLTALGARVELLDVRHIDVDRCRHFDCVLNRVYPSTIFEQPKSVLDGTFDVVKQLEQRGVFVLSGALSTVTDYSKFLAAQVLSMQGVRTPLTLSLTSDLAASSPPFLPAVIKPDIGAFGRDCILAATSEEWYAALATFDWRIRAFIVQQYVRPIGNVDYRITVMFGEIVFASKRPVVDGWFGNNPGRSPITDARSELSTEALELAVRSTWAIGALMNGVDLMIDRQGPIIIENNPTFGFSPEGGKVDVFARRIFDFLTNRARAQGSGRLGKMG